MDVTHYGNIDVNKVKEFIIKNQTVKKKILIILKQKKNKCDYYSTCFGNVADLNKTLNYVKKKY